MSKTELRMVLDSELRQLLDKLELLEEFEAGAIHCKFCNDVISEENLHAIFPLSDRIRMSCNKPECLAALVDLSEK